MPKVPTELTAAAQKDFAALGRNSVVGDVDKYLAAFVGPAAFLAVDSRPLAARRNPFEKRALTPYVAWKVASLVSWLFVNRPVGDPVRAGIPKVVAALQKVLADKRNLWEVESRYFAEEKAPKRTLRHAALTALVGGKPMKATKPGAWAEGRDDGTLVLAPSKLDATTEDASVIGGFYTAKLDDQTLARVIAFARAASDWERSEIIPVAQHIRSAGFAALGARVAKTDVPPGSFEANPLVSAKSLVATVAAAAKLSSEGAALYLQTLALPEPTKSNVCAWNGWTPAQYETVAGELVASKRVVQAKVDGAGRKIFAPGVVVKKTKLNLPIEQSKLAFLTHGRFTKHLVTEPCHTLFERAWSASTAAKGR